MSATENQPPQDVQDWFAALGVPDADRHERTLWARLIRLARQLRQDTNAIQAKDTAQDTAIAQLQADVAALKTKVGL